MSFKQLLCGLTRHTPIIRNQGGRRFQACFACDYELSPGWDLRDTRGRGSLNLKRGSGEQPSAPRVAEVQS
jgi:hypothetical protein